MNQTAQKRYAVLSGWCEAYCSETETTEQLETIIAAGKGGYSIAVNAEKLMAMRHNTALREATGKAAILIPDGIGAVWALKVLCGAESVKIDFPVLVLKFADARNKKLFLLGASPENNELAARNIRRNYPGLQLTGNRDGFGSDEEFIAVIRESGAEIVLLGLGSPKQELFAAKAHRELPGVFICCCGGAINIQAGVVKRAPQWIVNSPFEWLYRFQLKRWRRYLVLPRFMFHLAVAGVGRIFSKKTACGPVSTR